MNWVLQAIGAGVLFGIGIVLTNSATRGGVPLALSLGMFGFVWALVSGMMVSNTPSFHVPVISWTFLVLAGLVFLIGNFAQFTATVRAPFAGYAILVIAVVSASVTFGIDAVRHLRAGTFSVTPLEGAGLVLTVLALVCFTFGKR